jgi:hypothetical protein
MLGFVTKFKDVNSLDAAEDPKPKVVEPDRSEVTALFDPLAEESGLGGQQVWDLTIGNPR